MSEATTSGPFAGFATDFVGFVDPIARDGTVIEASALRIFYR